MLPSLLAGSQPGQQAPSSVTAITAFNNGIINLLQINTGYRLNKKLIQANINSGRFDPFSGHVFKIKSGG